MPPRFGCSPVLGQEEGKEQWGIDEVEDIQGRHQGGVRVPKSGNLDEGPCCKYTSGHAADGIDGVQMV